MRPYFAILLALWISVIQFTSAQGVPEEDPVTAPNGVLTKNLYNGRRTPPSHSQPRQRRRPSNKQHKHHRRSTPFPDLDLDLKRRSFPNYPSAPQSPFRSREYQNPHLPDLRDLDLDELLEARDALDRAILSRRALNFDKIKHALPGYPKSSPPSPLTQQPADVDQATASALLQKWNAAARDVQASLAAETNQPGGMTRLREFQIKECLGYNERMARHYRAVAMGDIRDSTAYYDAPEGPACVYEGGGVFKGGPVTRRFIPK